MQEVRVRRVLFVCTSNNARSQFAAALWQQVSEIPSASAGPHPAKKITRRVIKVASRHGVDLTGLTPRQLDDAVGGDDFIVTVCDKAHEELPELSGIHWSVPDPLRLNSERALQDAFADISYRVHDLAPRLRAT